MTDSQPDVVGVFSFVLKKNSQSILPFALYEYQDQVIGDAYSLSAFDTASLVVKDNRGGTVLFTVTGTIASNTMSFTVPPATTLDLEEDTGFAEIVLSKTTNTALRRVFVEGDVEFRD